MVKWTTSEVKLWWQVISIHVQIIPIQSSGRQKKLDSRVMTAVSPHRSSSKSRSQTTTALCSGGKINWRSVNWTKSPTLSPFCSTQSILCPKPERNTHMHSHKYTWKKQRRTPCLSVMLMSVSHKGPHPVTTCLWWTGGHTHTHKSHSVLLFFATQVWLHAQATFLSRCLLDPLGDSFFTKHPNAFKDQGYVQVCIDVSFLQISIFKSVHTGCVYVCIYVWRHAHLWLNKWRSSRRAGWCFSPLRQVTLFQYKHRPVCRDTPGYK